MSSVFGENIKISVFGQSHSKGVGVVIDGIPAGIRIDEKKLQAFMERRAPGRNDLSTRRNEKDVPVFLGGIVDGVTCGAPVAAIITNDDTRSKDYSELKIKPRPGHADYTSEIKYQGNQDIRGGGHFSARLTAPLCVAGGIILQILEEKGIYVGSHILSIKDIKDRSFNPVLEEREELISVAEKEFPVIDDDAGNKMQVVISEARDNGDSVGGVIEVKVTGVPAGLGDPNFSGMENRIASIAFGVPAVKGIEFGNGFEATKLFGSENNDNFEYVDGEVRTSTNNHGGILGGITTGMPLIFRVALKPTPSIFREQNTVNLETKENTILSLKGRHDPCVALRALPVFEAVTAIAIYDAYLGRKKEI